MTQGLESQSIAHWRELEVKTDQGRKIWVRTYDVPWLDGVGGLTLLSRGLGTAGETAERIKASNMNDEERENMLGKSIAYGVDQWRVNNVDLKEVKANINSAINIYYTT